MFLTGLTRFLDGLAIKVLMTHTTAAELGFLLDRVVGLYLISQVDFLCTASYGADARVSG